MSTPNRRQKRGPLEPTQSSQTEAGSWIGLIVLVAIIGLTVMTPLQPSEGAAEKGSSALLIVAWLAVAAFSQLMYAFWSRQTDANDDINGWSSLWADRRIRWPLVALACFIGWIVISALVGGHRGNYRTVLNALWQWIAIGVSIVVMVRGLAKPEWQRIVLLAGFATAGAVAAYGIYEWKSIHLEVLAQYEQDPESTMKAAGIVARPGSPAFKKFKDRLESTEPYSTFGLPNSLAGFLSTWLVIGVGIVWSQARVGWYRNRAFWTVLLNLVLIGFCLYLTKSRSAVLAAGIAVAGMMIGRAVSAPQNRRWVWIAGSSVLGLLGIGSVVLTLVDPLVLTEAPLSIRYRLEYWSASAQLIKDNPWFGCGVGNFQAFYPQYMLPWSSETVADPHNFFVEVMATAGIPAGLALLTMLGLIIAPALSGAWRHDSNHGSDSDDTKVGWRAKKEDLVHDSNVRVILLLGLALGLIGWMINGWLLGNSVNLILLLLLIVVGGIVLAGAREWIVPRSPTPDVIFWAAAAWWINASAAGAISHWGLSHSVWLLSALWLGQKMPLRNSQPERPNIRWDRRIALAIGGVMSVGLIAAVVWVLLPVTRVNRLLEETASDYDGMRAELRLNEAALADPLSSKPWEHLAALRLGQLLVEPTERNWDSFRQATDEVVGRNRHWAPLHRQIGDWHQAVAERSPVLRSRAQERMIRAYLRTIELHKGNAFYHAQLAWAYHIVGKAQAASQEADLALKLDSGMPHEELQLANQNLIEGMRVSKISAERRMQQLRNQ